MHYYQHNIADYRKDTSHLNLMEHGIYRQLLDSYYLDEIPLCVDLAKLMRSHSVRTADEEQALKNVLSDFFELTKKGYIHKRCDETIAQYHGKSDKARASAMARWASKHKGDDANALPTQSEGNTNHKPITNNHKPITKLHTPEGVSDDLWNDFLIYRKRLKAPVSERVLARLIKEAELAKMPLDQVLETIIFKGWRSFEASWIQQAQQKSTELPLGTEQQIEEAYRIECGGDPRLARFNSYFEMKKFIQDQRDKKRKVA
jgi:uncharacterized protein YdaU (DUF1376 family)